MSCMASPRNKGEDNTVYEVCYLLLPSIPEDKLPAAVSAIREIITAEGGEEIASEDPFKYPLAYTIIKKVGSSRYVLNDAYIGWIKFKVERSKITEIKNKLDARNEIARFILVKAPRETFFTFAQAKEAAARLTDVESAADEIAEEEVGPLQSDEDELVEEQPESGAERETVVK